MNQARSVTRVVPALSRMGGVLMRMVGSTDACGEGTEFAITDVGPFILVEDARGMRGRNLPPFGAHPHAGLVAVSYAASGGFWRSRSNAPGYEDLGLRAGDVLVTCAGRGIEHDERTATDGSHDLTQIILRMPADRRHIPASVVRHDTVEIAEGVVRLFDGDTLRGTGVDAAGHHVLLPGGQRLALDLDAPHTAAFAYVRAGAARVGGAHIEQGSVALLGERGAVELAADVGRGCDVLVFSGAPVAGAWVKRLGHNGFVVAGDVDAADALLDRYEQSPETFGH